MTMRSGLTDYKRHQGSETVFPGERRTTEGLFSGLGGRLVHIGRDGRLREFSYPLTGLFGIDRSRFGIRIGDDVRWLDEVEPTSQSYVGDTSLVETTYATDTFELERLDLTFEDVHVTHISLTEGTADALAAFIAFAPDGQDTRVGHIIHDDEGVAEVYHRTEHAFLAGAPGFESLSGQVPERLDDVLEGEPTMYPNENQMGQYEDGALGGYILGFVPFDGDCATVLTSVRERADTSAAIDAVTERIRTLDDAKSIREAAPVVETPRTDETIVDDLRVINLLSSERGGRIAGPDFDPYYEYSGGYGYTWFRDDAEIARFLLESDRMLELELSSLHEKSAAFYADTQFEDGTWPHRVWPEDGSIAPGWANDRLGGGGVDYQADQSASVLSYLAAYADTGADRRKAVEPTVESGLNGLDKTLGEDGLPDPCQNAWENMTGRFTHTAATFLHAYSAVGNAPFSTDLRDRSAERAHAVYDGLERLWDDDRGIYALRERDGELDVRLDSSTFALAEAHQAYAQIGSIDDERLERLHRHIDTSLDGLYRDTGSIRGLIRFEGDDWRARTQSTEKIWSVSTAWGANAAATLATLTGEDEYFVRSRELLEELLPGGSLCLESGYLPEQLFDDGTPDSATPLGWPHALRLATVAELLEAGELGATSALSTTGQ